MCERHKSHTGLANVVITNRCHLSCWYCFFYAKEGEAIYEPSMAEIRQDIHEPEEPEADTGQRPPDNRRRADDAPAA